jgi:hypothetical protein
MKTSWLFSICACLGDKVNEPPGDKWTRPKAPASLDARRARRPSPTPLSTKLSIYDLRTNKHFTLKEAPLMRDKLNLDIFWLKDESLEDSANLPEPDVIAAEIVEDRQAALAQVAEIANGLKRPN